MWKFRPSEEQDLPDRQEQSDMFLTSQAAKLLLFFERAARRADEV
jgi:hypothetical protein